MELKFGEKYRLRDDKAYFCIPIQRCVKFTTPVMVEFTSRASIGKPQLCFGKLIDVGAQDYVTNNEIEFFEEDVVGPYTMNVMPLFYMDFVYVGKEKL